MRKKKIIDKDSSKQEPTTGLLSKDGTTI